MGGEGHLGLGGAKELERFDEAGDVELGFFFGGNAELSFQQRRAGHWFNGELLRQDRFDAGAFAKKIFEPRGICLAGDVVGLFGGRDGDPDRDRDGWTRPGALKGDDSRGEEADRDEREEDFKGAVQGLCAAALSGQHGYNVRRIGRESIGREEDEGEDEDENENEDEADSEMSCRFGCCWKGGGSEGDKAPEDRRTPQRKRGRRRDVLRAGPGVRPPCGALRRWGALKDGARGDVRPPVRNARAPGIYGRARQQGQTLCGAGGCGSLEAACAPQTSSFSQ